VNIPKTDPLVASVKRVRREWRKTPPGKLQSLLDEQSKWKRRQTIADNKLAQVRKEIECLARELAEKSK